MGGGRWVRGAPDEVTGRVGPRPCGPHHSGLRAHRVFLVALLLAALVRLIVLVAFPPGFVFSDGPTYLGLVDDLTPLTERASGYGVFLDLLAHLGRGVSLIVLVQHLLGLVTATLVYLTLRRWSVSGVVATLASLPVLFDAMELVVEHSVLSDVLFDLLVVAAVAVLAWHRQPSTRLAALAGLLLGLAICVRVVGQPIVLAAVLFCLVVVPGLRRKILVSAVLVVAFAAPLTAYAAWYHQSHGVFALSESSGRALYMRTTTFVQCDQVSVPHYERKLCPPEPVGHRADPTFYGWHDPDGEHGLTPPAGITPDQAMHHFAIAAIKAQPLDYLHVVARDVAYNFATVRIDRYDYDTADKWSFLRYLDLEPTGWTRPAYAAHGAEMPTVRQPFANLLVAYNGLVYTWGPLLLGMVVLAVGGLLLPRPAGAARNRALIVLTGGVGLGLMVVPDLTAEFVWRYQLPAIVLLPMAAALAWTRLRTVETAAPLPAGPSSSPSSSPSASPSSSPSGSQPVGPRVSPPRPRRPAPTVRTAE